MIRPGQAGLGHDLLLAGGDGIPANGSIHMVISGGIVIISGIPGRIHEISIGICFRMPLPVACVFSSVLGFIGKGQDDISAAI